MAGSDAAPPKESTPLVGGKKGGEESKDGDLGSVGSKSFGEGSVHLEGLEQEEMKEKVVGAVGMGCGGTSLATLFFAGDPLSYFSGIIGTFVGPYAAIQQSKMTEVEALRRLNKDMEDQMGSLKEENDRLADQTNQLEQSVKKYVHEGLCFFFIPVFFSPHFGLSCPFIHSLKETQKTFESIQEAQGQSIDELEKQLKDTQAIYESLEDNLHGEILQNLINVVLGVDEDGDGELDDNEIHELTIKLEGLNGFDLDDEKFRQVIIDHGRSVNAIMELVRHLLDDKDGKDSEMGQVFKIHEMEG
eukprot:CAMPEP_0116840886 /NCGR_PEP_ID=MMETSP0418-20121206/10614_1 /TAXON_ID=1158023 /ORGANISM="Astrosyne radiata, Strain 13vi08-1A" /LENGTH=301 /DNA_ID=CAMNT_0004471243 /DNA_START=35 /DNA_END=939 /DNA_ORIENTATION=-